MGDQTLEDRGPTVFVVTLILIILATVFVILRLISKWGVTRKANADDYCTIVAWLVALGLAVSIMIGTTVGLGAPDSRKPSSITMVGPPRSQRRTGRPYLVLMRETALLKLHSVLL